MNPALFSNLIDPDIGPNKEEILRRYWRRSIEGPNVTAQFFWAYFLFMLVLWSYWVGPVDYLYFFGFLAALLAADIYSLAIGIKLKDQPSREIDAEIRSTRLGLYWVFRYSGLSFMLLAFGYIEGDTNRQLLLLVFPLVSAYAAGRDALYWRQIVTDLVWYIPMLVVYGLDTGLAGWPVLAAVLAALAITLIIRRGMYLELCSTIDNEVKAQELAKALEVQNSQLDEARIEAAAASQAKTRFLAVASHDLRQPMQAAVLFADLIKDDGPKKNREMVARLRQSLGSVSGLLEKLLDVSKLDAGIVRTEVEAIPLNSLVATIIDEINADDDVVPQLSYVNSSVWVKSDQTLLRAIVQNLIINAVRHSEAKRILIGLRRRGKLVRLEVLDDGKGIAANDQKKIFEEFHQLDSGSAVKAKGLGLGLSIIKRMARLLNHEIGVASTPGKGTRFWINLPVCAPVEYQPEPSELRSDFGGFGAIVIDDDDEVRSALRETLLNWHMAVYDGDGNLDPLEYCSQIDPDDIDIIICDFSLQSGTNGLVYADQIQQALKRELPVVIISGDIGREELTTLDKRATRLLSKPVPAEVLKETLATLFGHRSLNDTSM